MVEAFLRRRLDEVGEPATITSAGRLFDGVPVTSDGLAALRAMGIDASPHRSRRLSPAIAGQADLILAMAREHVRDAVVLDQELWPRTFTLKELVRRGSAVGPRSPNQPFDEWLAKVHAGRARSDALGASPDDDVADPIGGGPEVFRATAAELDDLTARLVELAWAHAKREGDPR